MDLLTPRRAIPVVSAAAIILAGCGGGGDSPDAQGATGNLADRAYPLAVATPAQSVWSPLRTLPLVPVSLANLPDGKVLMWSAEEKFSFGAATGRTYALTYDPATDTVAERTVTETGHNMFCPGTTNLPDGRLLVNGGISSPNTSIFNPATNTWSTGPAMNIPRGYQANTLLKDGSVLTLGGSWSGGTGGKHGEVWTAGGGWVRKAGIPIEPFLSVDNTRAFGMDSHFMLLPAGNGKVFHAGPGVNMHWIATEGDGRVTSAGRRDDDEFSISGNTVMYDAGLILKTGGGPGYDGVPANANSYVIDVRSGVQVRKINPMAYRRAFHNSVVLPNGQVLIVGGQTYAVGFSDNNSVLVPELFDPTTETFTTLPPITAPRNYHSVAILLPDARVLSAGGGLCGAGCAANHADLQILTPHYLRNPDGSAATRPVITTAPATVQYGQRATVATSGAVASFAMVRLSSTTHTVNNDQRRLALTHRSTAANSYEVDIPSNPGWALPGDWMLFALNADGVPSVARIVRITLDGAPRFNAIDDQQSPPGSALTLQPQVTAPAGTTLVHTATGLPPGLSIDTGNGRISGTPSTAGRYPVSLRASTGSVVVSTDFVWEVDAAASLVAGLKGEYFANRNLTGNPVRTVTEAVDYNWGTGSPGAGVPADTFSARWTGWLLPSVSGNHVLQTESDNGVRVWVNEVLVIDNWTEHGPTLDNSAAIALTAGQRTSIRMEFYEIYGGAVARLRWSLPGSSSFAAIPLANLRSVTLQANRAPMLATPAAQSTIQGDAASLQMSASDPDGDALTYSAAGLPPGMAIASASGLISGAPTTAGSFTVTVTADDGRGGNAAVQFGWNVLSAAPQILPVTAPPVAAGTTITYTAETSELGSYTYQWDFGDGSAPTAWRTDPTITHTYATVGVYFVTVSARTSDDRIGTRSFWQAVQGTSGQGGRSSSAIEVEPRGSSPARIWAVNPDNDSVSVFDASIRSRVAEIVVGGQPRTLALAPDGRVWVVNKGSATISIISPSTLGVVQTVSLARASQPYGIVIAADGTAFVTHEATGQLTRVAANGTVAASVNLGERLRHLALNAAGTQLLVARFVTPTLPGEGTAVVQTSVAGAPKGGEVLVVDAVSLALQRTIVLQHSEKADTTAQGRGVPNYLGAPVIAPDGRSAWVPSKQDNLKRGRLRDGLDLDFQNTLRAISSRIDLTTQAEDHAARIDHDNSGVASAAVFHPGGAYLFVALEASRHVAVVDAAGRRELLRIDAGRAPQALAVSANGLTLYVQNFMDRTVGVYDLTRLINYGESALPLVATMASVGVERLAANVLRGKQFFYDARDPRLARDGYVSCAGCHNDGGHDGRTWDFTGFGEGLRNTISLRGRAGAQGRLHWSANFNEVHDFEGQIRNLAQGTGLMTDAQFNTGTRSQPLGDAKAGVSADLDALAAYVGSLSTFDDTPYRSADASLTAVAVAGRTVFSAQCASCHGGADFTDSAGGLLRNVGTIKPSSGTRLGAALTGIDTPTLRDAWATAPYLHDGSAATLEAAIGAHNVFTLNATDLANVSEFVRQIGREEAAVAPPAPTAGLRGDYFAGVALGGTPLLTRYEAINFDWGSGAPAAGVPADNFSVRWSGFVRPTATGSYRFRTSSDDGVRVWVNGQLIINNWADHAPTTNTSGSVSLTAGQRYAVTVEYYERSGGAVMRWLWRLPGTTSYVAVPLSVLSPQ
jgi:YVTN family beta-propeller protein